MQWSKPPWRKLPKKEYSRNRLVKWRQFALAAAKVKGGRRACEICKRAIMGGGYIEVNPPWVSGCPKRRYLCMPHWQFFTDLIDKMEYELDNYDLPIDWTSREFTKGQTAHERAQELERLKAQANSNKPSDTS